MKRLADFLLLDLLFAALAALFAALPGFYLPEGLDMRALFLCWNVATLLAVAAFPKMPILPRSLLLLLLFLACIALGKFPMIGRRRLVTFLIAIPPVLWASRRLAAHLARLLVRFGRAERTVLLVGNTEEFNVFARAFRWEGWKDFARLEEKTDFADAEVWLRQNRCDLVYCSLAPETLPLAQRLFDYAENHLIRFYGVPENRAYFDRNLTETTQCGMSVLTARTEPLRRLPNRILKRSLDLAISIGFLSTVFLPILAIVAWKIKRESPGPVFFRQRRHGLDGREFRCWKFRSMHVNDQSDTAQTAKDDPRKFPFGDFMRRTNIDELPQFINVLMGEMSVVGPRPHPCKMTDDFGALVNRYRVRLLAKPGITGWAQVNGARGAALELSDMVKRVRLDIWYLEHWSFALDLRIIFETFLQTLTGHNKNAF